MSHRAQSHWGELYYAKMTFTSERLDKEVPVKQACALQAAILSRDRTTSIPKDILHQGSLRA